MNPTSKDRFKEFKKFWKNYLFQSIYATLVILIVLFLLQLRHAVIIASIGATAFIVFAMPKNVTAQPRNVIGGHLVGLLSGTLCGFVNSDFLLLSIVLYSLAVGLSIFIMVVTDTEHPPASGTALGIAISGFSLEVGITIIASAVILSLSHHFLKPYLRDLT